MSPCSKTDHYFLLAAKEDFCFEKYFVLNIYLRLLNGKNKFLKFQSAIPPPPR